MNSLITFGVSLIFEIFKWVCSNEPPQATTGHVDLDLRGRLIDRIRMQQDQGNRLRAQRSPGANSGNP